MMLGKRRNGELSTKKTGEREGNIARRREKRRRRRR